MWRVLVACGVAHLCATTARAQDDKGPLLEVVQEAYRTSVDSIRSGAGKGRFIIDKRASPDSDWVVVREADFEAAFLDNRIWVKLQGVGGILEYDRQIVIYDGSLIATSSFSDRVKPFGGEGQLFPARVLPGGVVLTAIGGIPWSPASLPETIIDLNLVVESVGASGVELQKQESGSIVGVYRIKGASGVSVEFTCDAIAGYNVTKVVASNAGWEWPATVVDMEWKLSKDYWWVTRVSETQRDEKGHESRSRWEYTEFEPNAPVDPSLFSLAALDLPPGARIVDHRPDVEGDDRFHYVPVPDAIVEAELGKVAEAVARLPTKPRPTGAPPTAEAPPLWPWLVGGNAVLVVVLLAWVYLRRARTA
jgi:hypothetical protein